MNGVPKSYFCLTDGDLRDWVRIMWAFANSFMDTTSNAVIGNYFETCLPRQVFGPEMEFHIKALHRESNITKCIKVSSLSSLPIPLKTDEDIDFSKTGVLYAYC